MHDILHIVLFLPLLIILYLDPGSGSLIAQLIIGALLALGLVARIFRGRIKGIFVHKQPDSDSSIDDPTIKKKDDIQ